MSSSGPRAAAFSIGASLLAMAYDLGNASGAHFNPAVTSAIFLSGRDAGSTLGSVVSYWVLRFVGGICAALSRLMILDKVFKVKPGLNYDIKQAAVAEIVFIFVPCYVVLGVAASEVTKSARMFDFAIASCICGARTSRS